MHRHLAASVWWAVGSGQRATRSVSALGGFESGWRTVTRGGVVPFRFAAVLPAIVAAFVHAVARCLLGTFFRGGGERLLFA